MRAMMMVLLYGFSNFLLHFILFISSHLRRIFNLRVVRLIVFLGHSINSIFKNNRLKPRELQIF